MNWSVIEFTDIECNVNGFSNDLGSINKIPVATVGTLWVNPADGRHYILVMCKALYFDKYLDHSLINPNQIRMFLGDVVQDNPLSDNEMGINIEAHDLHLPFTTSGTTIYWESTKPSTEEIEKYTHIILTSDEPWSPSTVQLRQGSAEEKGSIFNNRIIFEITTSHSDHDEYESDYILEGNFGMTEQLFYQRVISKVQTLNHRRLLRMISTLLLPAMKVLIPH